MTVPRTPPGAVRSDPDQRRGQAHQAARWAPAVRRPQQHHGCAVPGLPARRSHRVGLGPGRDERCGGRCRTLRSRGAPALPGRDRGPVLIATASSPMDGLRGRGVDDSMATLLATGRQDTAWTACMAPESHPVTRKPCQASFLDCFPLRELCDHREPPAAPGGAAGGVDRDGGNNSASGNGGAILTGVGRHPQHILTKFTPAPDRPGQGHGNHRRPARSRREPLGDIVNTALLHPDPDAPHPDDTLLVLRNRTVTIGRRPGPDRTVRA